MRESRSSQTIVGHQALGHAREKIFTDAKPLSAAAIAVSILVARGLSRFLSGILTRYVVEHTTIQIHGLEQSGQGRRKVGYGRRSSSSKLLISRIEYGSGYMALA